MKYLFLLSFALIINMHPAYAQSKSLAAEVAATAMATLWKVPVGADTAKPTKWTYGQIIQDICYNNANDYFGWKDK
jgi:hypothetical protein